MVDAVAEIEEILEILSGLQIPIGDDTGAWPRPPDRTTVPVGFGKQGGPGRGRRSTDVSSEVLERLDAEVTTEVEGPLTEVLDTLAWYSPFHFHADRWGIYLRERAILMLAGRIGGHLSRKRITDPAIARDAIWSATYALYFHEAFHHYTESFATRLELIEGQERYRPYHREVYARLTDPTDPLEEALACADMVRRQKVESALKTLDPTVRQATVRMLADWIPCLPNGYREGIYYVEKTDFDEGRNRLGAQIQTGFHSPFPDVRRWRQIGLANRHGMFKGLEDLRKNTHLVAEDSSSLLAPIIGSS